ncbi:hypothetical protein QTH87_04705 [Variovorax sp. J22P168]|uniref:hypothetical protein n=1 Tax=Variovorax jilinensis TaxID=3053513 RepID=UPI002578AE50|nr:hypothetical protein [Variovorax sp. J22P168]MDM0011732.1 hypothetical protein [Variovorax sp. J22P168]
MTLAIRQLEQIDARVLGALRCVDAGTRSAIDLPLAVRIEGARVRRNRSGLHVITEADGLAAHASAFEDAPAEPALGSVALTASLIDPSGAYLPRIATIALPRDAAPANASAAGSLFRPIEIAMYPGATAALGVNWAVLRVSLTEAASGDALGGALLLVRSGTRVLARGLSDWRGEALVPVPGVPVTTWSDEAEAVVVSETAARLELVWDPAAGLRVPAADVRAGRAPARLPQVDPDRLEAERADLPGAVVDLQLRAGRSQTLSLALALP